MMRKYLFKICIMPLYMICFIFGLFLFTGKKCSASDNHNWKSVHNNDTYVDDFLHYVKYGDLLIAINNKGIYIKDKLDIIYKKGGYGYTPYGGVLTNGKDILYQDGRNVYLYKNAKKKLKAFSLPKKNDVLLGRYGNNIYYGKEVDYDVYAVYKYNIKTGKKVKMPFYNAYCCYHKYLMINGQFHEGVATPLIIYNIKTGKETVITNNGLYANAAIISGNTVYYTEYNYDKGLYKLMTYNLKTSKKKTIQKNLSVPYRWIDKNHYYMINYDDKNVYVYNNKTGEHFIY